jgi:hypothetical protein
MKHPRTKTNISTQNCLVFLIAFFPHYAAACTGARISWGYLGRALSDLALPFLSLVLIWALIYYLYVRTYPNISSEWKSKFALRTALTLSPFVVALAAQLFFACYPEAILPSFDFLLLFKGMLF